MDEFFMREALREADTAANSDEMPVGCVIVKDGEIIARGHNTREKENNPVCHAEINAIVAAAQKLNSWRLNGCTLYVTLEPCPMCAGAIVQSRISRLVYAAPDKAQGCAGSIYRLTEDPAFSHFCPSDGGILRAEAERRLAEFFAKRRGK